MDSTTWMAIFTCVVGVSTVLVALFTYRLWKATQDYARVTKKLLEQSQAASKQSRAALLIDVIDRTIQSMTQPLTDGRIDEFAGSFAEKLAIIDRIDEKAAFYILLSPSLPREAKL